MAIALASKTNVDNSDPDYPYGKIKNDTGVGDGTPIDVQVYGDHHQFFAKLLDASGFAANGVPDNDANGYQYFDALMQVLFSSYVPSLAYAGTYQDDATSPLGVRRVGFTRVHIKGKISNSVPATINTSQTIFTLPTGSFRPAQPQLFMVAADSASRPAAIVQILTTGEVKVRGDLLPFSNNEVYINISFDND